MSSYNYCVIYTRAAKQWKVKDAIGRFLPELRGLVFFPCVELWWHGSDTTVIRPLFKGYIFIRSDLKRNELHKMIKHSRQLIYTYVRELNLDNVLELNEEGDSDISDLTDEEAEFLDFLLGFSDDNGDCIIHMSYGYRDRNGEIVIMEGPLKGYESHITDINLRQRKAYLDLKICGHNLKAGLTIRPMRHYYPNDPDAPELLSDGGEVSVSDLAKSMMNNGLKDRKT